MNRSGLIQPFCLSIIGELVSYSGDGYHRYYGEGQRGGDYRGDHCGGFYPGGRYPGGGYTSGGNHGGYGGGNRGPGYPDIGRQLGIPAVTVQLVPPP